MALLKMAAIMHILMLTNSSQFKSLLSAVKLQQPGRNFIPCRELNLLTSIFL